ncbi:MAG: response regulator transcription factor [Patescibacteria group bacterium]
MSVKKVTIKVLPVDDHPVVVEGVRSMLRAHIQFEVVGVAAGGEDALAKAKKFSPDVILMDTNMPGLDGIETMRRILAVQKKIKVLMFAGSEDAETTGEMIAAGAKGCIRKGASATELVSALERVHRGETFFSADVAQMFFEDYVKRGGRAGDNAVKRISERERQVLHLLVDGAANKEMADTLGLSVRTIEKHRQRIMKKLGVHKATELVRFAITKGLVSIG